MNHWKHAKKYGVLIVLICAALCFWLSQAQGAEMGSFSGKVFEDLNNDGIMDENDPGVAGVTLRLAGKKTGQTFELVTDETGLFTFADLPKDRYVAGRAFVCPVFQNGRRPAQRVFRRNAGTGIFRGAR